MEERGIAVGFVARRDTEGPIPPELEAGGAEAAADEAAGAATEAEVEIAAKAGA